MATRSGWYMPSTNTEHGDPEFSAEARSIWEQRELSPEKVAREVHEDPETDPDRPDHVSVFQQEDGDVGRYLILRDTVTKADPPRPRRTAFERILDEDDDDRA